MQVQKMQAMSATGNPSLGKSESSARNNVVESSVYKLKWAIGGSASPFPSARVIVFPILQEVTWDVR